jgi:hypothetical protein
MGHPNGGRANYFNPKSSFDRALAYVDHGKVIFPSTTGEQIIATTGKARDGVTPTVVFQGINVKHGNVCQACWGYRLNCSGARIGQCTEALDSHITHKGRR